MFEQIFKNIDDVLRKDAGCTSELDYTEQTSWLLFLKYLDALENDKAIEANLSDKPYTYILEPAYRWDSWAAPKDNNGKIDHNTALTGDDLLIFVNQKLLPYLHGFKTRAHNSNTIEYKIGEIFGEIKNRIQSGYTLREVIDLIDSLRFRSQTEKHELSHLYEAKIKNMGNAGRNGGEYYTPRALIRTMIQVTQPKIGETIYDGAVGSAGFLCEAFDYLRSKPNLTTTDLATLQTSTFYGKEKKPLAYVIAIMNMILHGIEAPNILHTNTLAENLNDIQEKDRYNVILANPPFGGKERKEVQQNFPIRTGETAFLFLQHFIKSLKAGGRAAVVIKNTFLSNTDNASISLRKHLLSTCNLHTILDCPSGTFLGAGVKTVVLFFTKGAPTQKTWYYQLDPGRTLGKTNPLNDTDLADFVALQKSFALSSKSWSFDISAIDSSIYDMSAKNPNRSKKAIHRSSQEILNEITELDAESKKIITTKNQFDEIFSQNRDGWQKKKLKDICSVEKQQGIHHDLPYVGMEHIEPQTGRFIGSQEPCNVKSATFKFSPDYLLYGRLRPYLNKVLIPKFCGHCSTEIFPIKPHPILSVDFLKYWFLSAAVVEKINATCTGARMPRANMHSILNFDFWLPPLAEQQRIVALLDESHERIHQLKSIYQRKLAALEELKKALLERTFIGEL